MFQNSDKVSTTAYVLKYSGRENSSIILSDSEVAILNEKINLLKNCCNPFQLPIDSGILITQKCWNSFKHILIDKNCITLYDNNDYPQYYIDDVGIEIWIRSLFSININLNQELS